jgi:peptidyl-prolyl cis-trans isomerase C
LTVDSLAKEAQVAKAQARHILVSTKEQCEELKKQIEAGADFAELAKQHSQCPSGQRGGDLGEFSPGQMVKEFDQVVFGEEVGKTHGPVQTQFGFHLIEIVNRSD